MASTATLQLVNPGGQGPQGNQQGLVLDLPFDGAKQLMFGGLATFIQADNKNKLLLDRTMEGLALAYNKMSLEDREMLDENSGEQGFLNVVYAPKLYPRNEKKQVEWAQSLGRFILDQDTVMLPPNPPAPVEQKGGSRNCGCGTPGCKNGGGAKLSPGVLAKVRRHLAKS